MKTIIRKIPGALPPPPKSEIDGKVTDLCSKSVPELLELRDRQLKLLKNKPFITKLADKGTKIQAFHDRIVYELKSKQEEEQATAMLENLKLTCLDRDTVQNVEWEGKVRKPETYLDSDDDSEPEDVLQILSQSTATEKKVKVIEPEAPLITPKDLEKIGEIPHVQYLVDKTENNKSVKPQSKFKPYQTTVSDVHSPDKEIKRKKGKHWEVTSATPPPTVHGPAKVLSIDESLKLQKEYNKHLKEIEMQHAAEKLIARMGIKMAELPENTSGFGKYREVSSDTETSDPEGSDKEVHDEEPEKGGVFFTVMK